MPVTMNGQLKEIAPGKWRLRVYLGRNSKGMPILRSKTIHAPGEPRPGAGRRIAQRELAKMVAEVAKGNTATGAETLGQLLDAFVEHLKSLDRSPTTLREYRRFAAKVVSPELRGLKLSKLTARGS